MYETIGPTLDEQIQAQPSVASIEDVLKNIDAAKIEVDLRTFEKISLDPSQWKSQGKWLGPDKQWVKEINLLLDGIQSKIGTKEGFIEVMNLIASHPFTKLPLGGKDLKEMEKMERLDKISSSKYTRAQEVAKELALTAEQDFSKIKNIWELPVASEEFGEGVTKGSVLTQAIAIQYMRGKWLEENVFPRLSMVTNNAAAKVDALAQSLYQEHDASNRLRDPSKDVNYLSDFNYGLKLSRPWGSLGCYVPSEKKIYIRANTNFTEGSLKKIEGAVIHELYHYYGDHRTEMLMRGEKANFIKITAEDPQELFDALQKRTYDRNKILVDKNYLPKNENLGQFNFPLHTSLCNEGLLPTYMWSKLSKEDSEAFVALNEAVTEAFSFQVDAVAKWAENRRRYEHGQKNLETPGFAHRETPYYRDTAYKHEIDAFLNVITKFNLDSASFFKAALSAEEMMHLQDELMKNPLLEGHGKTGFERLKYVAHLVLEETTPLKAA